MKILFLTHAFNGLAQRLFVELGAQGHEVAIEFDVNDATTEQALALAKPDLVIAPFLKRAIPDARVEARAAASWCTRAFPATAARRRSTGRSSRARRSGA